MNDDTVQLLQEMTDLVLAEAPKKAKKGKGSKNEAPPVQPGAYSYSEAFDFSQPLGAMNLYRNQGDTLWGPQTSPGTWVDLKPAQSGPMSSAAKAVMSAWEKLAEAVDPGGTWEKALKEAK